MRLPLLLAVVAALPSLARTPLARPSATRPPRTPHTDTSERDRRFAAAALTAGLFAAQNLFLASSNNQPQIALPFAGLLVALGGRVAWGRARERRQSRRRRGSGVGRVSELQPAVVAAATALAAAILLAAAVDTALSRRVHDVFPAGTRFTEPLAAAGLRPLLWAEPTTMRETGPDTGGRSAPAAGAAQVSAAQVSAAQLEALVARLKATDGAFFVFPDWTFLYAVVGRPSPQPLLWFHPGLTYPPGGDPTLDRWIVAELERHRVSTVVIEDVSWLGTEHRLADFPQLAAWIEHGFRPAGRIGPFRLLERPASGAGDEPGYGAATASRQ